MRTKNIDSLKKQNETLKLEVENKKMKRFLSSYDVVESNRYRRQPQRELKDEGEIYSMSKRLLGCNLGRDLERNYSPAKSMLHQCRVNVVGSLGKIQVNAHDDHTDAEEKSCEAATAWFNEIWAKDCDYRDDLDFSTLLQNILASELRDGDILALVDDNITKGDTGKILTWESDQIAPVSKKILEESAKASDYRSCSQDSGILREDYGRVVAYCASGKRGLSVIEKEEDVTFWKRGIAKLIKMPWRLNQGRGTPILLTPAANMIDLYEMLASELQSAKRTAKQYAYVKRENAVTDWDNPAMSHEYLPENDGKTAGMTAIDGQEQSPKTALRNYERLESFSGGLVDYLDAMDKVEFPAMNHPNKEMAPFISSVHDLSGAALGLAHAYTVMKADTSYTAFRGDMIMTWVTFYWMQKQLERSAADWIAQRVLRWAMRKKHIPVLPNGWEHAISWKWPVMPEVDALAAEKGIAESLKNATTDYNELLGPDWEKRLRKLGKQIEVLKEIEYPAGVLESRSGGVAAQPAEQANKQKGNTNEQE